MKADFSAVLLCKRLYLQCPCSSDRSSFLSFISRGVAHTATANQVKLIAENGGVFEHTHVCMQSVRSVCFCTLASTRLSSEKYLICFLLTKIVALQMWKRCEYDFVPRRKSIALSVHFLFPELSLDGFLTAIAIQILLMHFIIRLLHLSGVCLMDKFQSRPIEFCL